MIARYEVADISKLWTDHAKFSAYLRVEIALLETLEARKMVPAGTAAAFSQVQIKPERIDEIERITRHDVIAFCTSITEQVEERVGRFFHYGATSSDIIDSALSIQMQDSLAICMKDLDALIATLGQLADRYKTLVAMGRSHGMNAEPMVFGQKFLSFCEEFKRRRADYESFAKDGLTVQMSGAVGSYTILTPEIEREVAQKLGMPVEPVSTQVIPRDRIAKLVSLGALTASAIERIAVEIRHLHHSDIGEVTEGFAKGQKGSSAMPQKKNPISSENLTGMARMLRAQVIVALENCALWHERDISHSSAERMMLPDHFGILAYSLRRLNDLLNKLEVNEEHVESKWRESFGWMSSAVLHDLILKNEASREKLYAIVQEAAFKAESVSDWRLLLTEKCAVENLSVEVPDTESMRKRYIERFKQKLV